VEKKGKEIPKLEDDKDQRGERGVVKKKKKKKTFVIEPDWNVWFKSCPKVGGRRNSEEGSLWNSFSHLKKSFGGIQERRQKKMERKYELLSKKEMDSGDSTEEQAFAF